MACLLGNGFTLDCRKSIGGVDEFWIGELDGLNTSTFATSGGVVTVMAMTGGKLFYNYKVRKATSEAKADIGGDVNVGAGYIDQMVTIQLDKFDVAKRNEVRILAQKPLMIIVKDATGQYLLFGSGRGLDLQPGSTGGTGKEANSLNGFVLNFKGEELEYPYDIPLAIINTLI